jgi:epidermal growth factor receptor substrate 15
MLLSLLTHIGSAPQKNLLDNDDDPETTSAHLYDQSAEIGNLQNHVNSTNRSLETTKVARASVEQTLANQAGQLSALQTQLSSAKAAYETETKSLSTLRERLSAQTADIQKTREDLIRAESDLSAVRVEKAELEGSFLRDKEEARELHRKMVEAGQQAESMKLGVEKAKKEAKQQKGLLAIARKQLSTKEIERARAERELEDANAEATEATKKREEAEAEIPSISSLPSLERAGSDSHALPVTPDISSPMAVTPNVTGKSNNPFERLAKSVHPTLGSHSPFLLSDSTPLPTPSYADAPLAAPSDDPFGLSNLAMEGPTSPQETILADGRTSVTKEASADISISSISSVSLIPSLPAASSENEHITPLDTAASRATSPGFQIANQNATKFPALHDPPESNLPGHFPLSPDYHEHIGEIDLMSQPVELDVDASESGSDSDDDEVPLSEIKAKVFDKTTNITDGTVSFDAPPTVPFDDAFGQPMDTSVFTAPSPLEEHDLASPITQPPTVNDAFGASITQTSRPFITPTLESNATSSAIAGASAFDEAMGKIPGGSMPGAPQLSFETAFDDNFDFASAKFPSLSVDPNGKIPTVSSATTNGFDSILAPNKGAAVPAGDSQRSSFENTFASTFDGPPQVSLNPSTQADLSISFDEAFSEIELSQTLKSDSSFASLPSRASPVLPRPAGSTNPRPFSTMFLPASQRSASSPVRVSTIEPPSPPPRQRSPPPRISSPKPRPSTSSSGKEPQERPKDPPPRHSKLSVSDCNINLLEKYLTVCRFGCLLGERSRTL